MTREVPLSRGLVALVDDADYELIKGYRWRATPDVGRRTVYAVASIREEGRKRAVWMHRLITAAPVDSLVDHVNGDGLDNRRSNLRPCSAKQNTRNRRRHENNTTGFKGVAQDKRDGRYRAYIMVDGAQVALGGFACPLRAARAYDRAAAEHFGEFASLNFAPRRDWLFPHEHQGAWPPP